MPRRSHVKMMIYSQDGFGLGHLRRNLNIAIQVQKRAPSATVLLVADSPAAPFFRLPPHCDFVKIPTLVKVNTGTWRSDRLTLEDRHLLAIRSELIQDVAVSFRPDLFLVDHMPNGVGGELASALETLKQRCPETQVILGLRDILGAPADICRQWHQDHHYTAAESFYDNVFVYGCQEIFHVAEEYRFSESILAKLRYCGYVSREHVHLDAENSGASNGKPTTRPLILVTGGGGADSSFFIDSFLDAAAILTKLTPFRAIAATGPFLHPEQFQLLHDKAKGLPVQVVRNGQDSLHLLKRADLVISMAGYNTITEIMRFRKKAIVIPRPGPSAEQTMRTRIMSERGLFTSIHPHDLTPERLAKHIAERLTEGSRPEPSVIPRLDGASRAATLMMASLLAGAP